MRAEKCVLAESEALCYEIHLINAQDGYAYAGVKRYSEENLKIHRCQFWCILALKFDTW